MKSVFYIFLYLNIYTLFSPGLLAQKLYLEISAEKPISETLKDSLSTTTVFNDYSSLQEEAERVPTQLQRFGFIAAELKSLSKKTDTTYHAFYNMGPKFTYIKVYHNNEIFSRKQLQRISNEVTDNYFILDFETAEQALQELNNLQTENGNSFARLRLGNLIIQNNIVIAQLETEGEQIRTLDSIVVKGYEKFPKSFLKYYAGLKKGKPFSKTKLLKQNTIIDNLGFASTTKSPEILFRKETTVAYLYLEKQNNNLFDGILGFATDETTQRLQLNGYINLELNNNLNFGEQLIVNYKADGNEQQNFRAKVTMPYILKSPFGVGLELKIFKRDSTFVTTEQLAQISYQINPISSVYGGYKGYESNNLLDLAVAGTAVEDYTSKFLITGGTLVLPQESALFPKKTELQLQTEIGSRESKGTNEDQLRGLITVNHIFNLNDTNAIYLQNTTGALLSDTYFTNELFRFGGINSIRGFNENSIDASLYSVLNTEYRYIFNQGLYLHSIIDLGYFENDILEVKEKLYSFGIGLGLQTRGGLLRFNLANGNSENQDFRFSNTKIHLSLTSRF
ncbi:MAG TPA: hypothetical protein EYN07_02820 [Flavobacteriaceae bacterium]|nr:hypothetical protein [Flavobacteriaceae bacterium]HIN98152.1 hypothetical protein [Flavobacteriaceae bacterium]